MSKRAASNGHLGPGRRLVSVVKATGNLRPGEAVKVAGLGTFAISAPPLTVPGGLTVVPLAWERLALLAEPSATWDAVEMDPPIWRYRPCRSCGGSGRG